MAADPIFTHEITFAPGEAAATLRALPAAAGVVALFGHNTTDRPYLVQSANLRRRLQNLLQPAEGQTKRLNLRDRIARIAWRQTHSQLESLLLLHRASVLAFGADDARKRMRLTPPFTVRYAVENRFPRIYVTNHLRRRSLHTTFGPFASRNSAERYREAVEELFVIRRCFLELHPSPEDPGCIYGEMRKCMAPCQVRCTDEEYNTEAERTLSFLRTRGASLIGELEGDRDRASADMLFEEAAAAHTRITRVKAVAALADDLVQPLDNLRAVLLVPCPDYQGAKPEETAPHIQVFAYTAGCLRGPISVSLLGVRLAKEQHEVGSSLFAQPMMLSAVPLAEPKASAEAPQDRVPHLREAKVGEAPQPLTETTTVSAEERLLAAIAQLEDGTAAADTSTLGDHLALLRRWYYRPEKKREGTLFQPDRDTWPIRRMVRAAAKLAISPTPAPTTAVATPTENAPTTAGEPTA